MMPTIYYPLSHGTLSVEQRAMSLRAFRDAGRVEGEFVRRAISEFSKEAVDWPPLKTGFPVHTRKAAVARVLCKSWMLLRFRLGSVRPELPKDIVLSISKGAKRPNSLREKLLRLLRDVPLHEEAARFVMLKALQLGATKEQLRRAADAAPTGSYEDIPISDLESRLVAYRFDYDPLASRIRLPMILEICQDAANHWFHVVQEQPQTTEDGAFCRTFNAFTSLVHLEKVTGDMLARHVVVDGTLQRRPWHTDVRRAKRKRVVQYVRKR